MPDNFDDNSVDNLSIDEINELFSDIIETDDDMNMIITYYDCRLTSKTRHSILS